MNTWTEDDITALLADPEFGETVYYFPCYGSPDVVAVWMEGEAITALSGDPFEPINLVSGVVESSSPSITLRTADVPALMHNDQFRIRGQDHIVTSTEPDNDGFTVVRLRKA
jgi:hypothetical protein